MPSSVPVLDPVKLLLEEAKATLTYFGLSEADQSILCEQVLTEIGNPQLRQALQSQRSEDPFADFDPETEPSEEVRAARELSIEATGALLDKQLALVTLMKENLPVWFVLRARLVDLSVQIDQQMSATSQG